MNAACPFTELEIGNTLDIKDCLSTVWVPSDDVRVPTPAKSLQNTSEKY